MIDASPLIRFDRVYKLYRFGDAGVAALTGVSLDIASGEFVSIVGPSGAGKSSILNLIGGIDRATAGTVSVDGQDLGRLNDARLSDYRRRTVGFVWQGSARNLVPYLSAQNNIDLPMSLVGAPAAARSRRVRELLELFGLEHCAERPPGTLSGGEQQRVAVAVALANLPSILLADEPTAEIDAAASESVIDAFRSATTELRTTVVMVTHDRIAAAKSDRVYRLIDGRLRATPRFAHVDERGGLTLPEEAARLLAAREVEVEVEQGEVRIRDTFAGSKREGAVAVIELASDVQRGGVLRSEPFPFEPDAPTRAQRPHRSMPSPAGGDELLAGKDLVRTFLGPPPTLALQGVSVSVSPGDFVVLMGPSGSGKSTLLGLLAGLDHPDEGHVFWEGRPLGEFGSDDAARYRATRLGIVLQSFGLVPWLSALENVELPLLAAGVDRGAAAGSATSWLGRLGLADRLDHRTFELSAGQQQRIAVARAVAGAPRTVLADEPTAEVDAEAREVILSVLREVADRGGAVIVATHDPSVLGFANRAFLLRDGRIEAEGSPDEIAPRVTTG